MSFVVESGSEVIVKQGVYMDWRKLLSTTRISSTDKSPGSAGDHRTEFQRDWDRIVFSTAFRRLHDKTQVFPFPEDDVVHSRLTHSLEVASVGRSLGTKVGESVGIVDHAPGVTPSDVGNIVAAACLAHDIGNPPFGHAGEDALQRYFKLMEVGEALTPRQLSDVTQFEGNAQGFRILTRLQFEEYGGLRLTAATLGAFLKYPRESGADLKDLGGQASKKFGAFQSEMHVLEQVADELGLHAYHTVEGGRGWMRSPLAYVVEAADDICNAILDLEDGARLGCLSSSTLDSVLLRVARASAGFKQSRYEAFVNPRDKTGYLRAQAIGVLVGECAKVFVDNESVLLMGTDLQPLVALTPYRDALRELAALARDKCYRHPPVLERETAGYAAIAGLLELFIPCVVSVEPAERGSLESRLLDFLDQRTLLQLCPPGDKYGRVLRVLDYVSGMTDTYVAERYRKLTGMTT
ncbi:MAG: dNTP triphosphohydrolase [Myxococcales bacterium]|nr:dNTP triphosphohydrolase [Myxococcales bacterium]